MMLLVGDSLAVFVNWMALARCGIICGAYDAAQHAYEHIAGKAEADPYYLKYISSPPCTVEPSSISCACAQH